MGAALTDRQVEIRDYIVDRIRSDGVPPTIREISAGVGIKSPLGVVGQLKALARKGAILWDRDHRSRGIRLPGDACPCCGGTGRTNNTEDAS